MVETMIEMVTAESTETRSAVESGVHTRAAAIANVGGTL